MTVRRPPYLSIVTEARPTGKADPACVPFVRLLSASIDLELPPEEDLRLAEHLASCARCTARKARLLVQSEALKRFADERVDELDLTNFSSLVMQAVARDQSRPRGLAVVGARLTELWTARRPQLMASMGGFAAAACLLLAVTVHKQPGAQVAQTQVQAPLYAAVEALDVQGGSSAVLDLDGHDTTVIWVSEDAQ